MQRMRLGGAVALVIGVSRFALMLARQLADKGCHLALLDGDEDELRLAEAMLAPRTRVLVVACDVRDRAAVDAAVACTLDELGRIDLVIDFCGAAQLRHRRKYDLTSMAAPPSPERAARRIVRAIADGETEVALGWRERLLRLLAALQYAG
jgi:NAD(P)-dependent dehydrogenase (short-subunit alcohol dehydrogenase family)